MPITGHKSLCAPVALDACLALRFSLHPSQSADPSRQLSINGAQSQSRFCLPSKYADSLEWPIPLQNRVRKWLRP
ncbi:Uncharacterised protein [Vibrio cholerae]|nr:Uncharacterised protein [Vibrio cholerae]